MAVVTWIFKKTNDVSWLLWIIFLIAYSLSPAHGLNRLQRSSGVACGLNMFTCSDANCVFEFQRCNSQPDCADGSDESDCELSDLVDCPPNSFKCSDGGPDTLGECVDELRRCDGQQDCSNSKDEQDCEDHVCAGYTCPSGNRTCISEAWRCDREPDCPGAEDELDCKHSCESHMKSCNDNETCIDRQWECDGHVDCPGGEDEAPAKCGAVTCPNGNYQCTSGQCIPKRWRCDQDTDCEDLTDEQGCPTAAPGAHCSALEMYCAADDHCLPDAWKCDGQKDCSDGEDEKDCAEVTCRPDQWHCSESRYCIAQHLRCNGEAECRDGTDERGCDFTARPCLADELSCGEHGEVCVPDAALCNSTRECPDGADEDYSRCQTRNQSHACTQHNCSQECVAAFNQQGYACTCWPGYKLAQYDNHTCLDVNECLGWGACSQACTNSPGSFTCGCWPGYWLDPRTHSCKAHTAAQLLVSQRTDIRLLGTRQRSELALVSDVRDAVAIDYSLERKLIFWSDLTDEAIYSKNESQHSPRKLADIQVVDGLAYDWVHHLLFFTEAKFDIIVAMTPDGDKNTTVIADRLDEPRAIVVDPDMRLLFWTDWGREPKIERSGMDGLKRTELVSSKLVTWPNGLTIDYTLRRLFWVDGKRGEVGTVDYDGFSPRMIVANFQMLPHPFSIAVFEDSVFITDWDRSSIVEIDKFSGVERRELYSNSTKVMALRIRHPLLQPKATSACRGHSCAHMCLPSEAAEGRRPYRCSCPPGAQLDPSDFSSCAVRGTTAHAASSSQPSATPSSSAAVLQEVTAEASAGPVLDKSTGRLAGIVIGAMSLVMLLVAVIGLLTYRCYRTHSRKTVNFDNPVYRKTSESEDTISLEQHSMHAPLRRNMSKVPLTQA